MSFGIETKSATMKKDRPVLEIVRSEDVFDSLEREWDVIAQCCESATVYQTFSWQRLWWKYFSVPSRQTLHILVVRIDREICGIAPCFLERTNAFGSTVFQRLRLIGSGDAFTRSHGLFLDDGPSDFLDFLALPGRETEVSREIVDYLARSQDEIDEIEFLNASPTSILRTYVIPMLEALGLPLHPSQADPCTDIEIPDSMPEYFGRLSGGIRRRFSQALRAYHQQDHYQVRCVGTDAELHTEFQNLSRLHQKRWNDLGFPGLFHDRRSAQFQRAVAERLLSRGKLWFRACYSGGDCIATRLAFEHKNRIYDYLSGIDTDKPSAKYRPGLALLLAIIEEASGRGIRSIDFLRGDEQYKLDFSPRMRYNWNYRVFMPVNRTSGQRVLHRLARAMEFVRFHAKREAVLLEIQYRKHSVWTCLYYFWQFRHSRLRVKLQRAANNEGAGDE